MEPNCSLSWTSLVEVSTWNNWSKTWNNWSKTWITGAKLGITGAKLGIIGAEHEIIGAKLVGRFGFVRICLVFGGRMRLVV